MLGREPPLQNRHRCSQQGHCLVRPPRLAQQPAEIVARQRRVGGVCAQHLVFDRERSAIVLLGFRMAPAGGKHGGKVVQARRHLVVLRPELALEDRERT